MYGDSGWRRGFVCKCHLLAKREKMQMPLPRLTVIDRGLQEFADCHGFVLHINGHCMMPTLNDRDRVLVRRAAQYRTGDILAVRLADGQLVCHRLIGTFFWGRETHYMTRPDRGGKPDAGVTRSMIIGKISARDSGVLLPIPTVLFRLQLFLSFFYCLCRRFFEKIK